MNRTLVIGAQGNMGRRYVSILNLLQEPFMMFDVALPNRGKFQFEELVKLCNKIIVATPTESHYFVLQAIVNNANPGTDILCEKPVVKHTEELRLLLDDFSGSEVNLFMVNQYAYLEETKNEACADQETFYHYYQSGKDGLLWDCIQFFQLAKGSLHLSNKSPIWSCQINGRPISRGSIDSCYISMLNDFLGLKQRCWGIDIIKSLHEKVFECEANNRLGPDEFYIVNNKGKGCLPSKAFSELVNGKNL